MKNFVLDTNVLLHDPTAVFRFEENTVNIPIFVIEEIDRFKRDFTELGRNARAISRILDDHRERGSLGEGVKMDSGGTLRVWFELHDNVDGSFLDSHTKDNLILSTALKIQANESHPCIFVTKDINLRVRADAMGLKAENYESDIIPISELYPGACELVVSDEQINHLHELGELRLSTKEYQPLAPSVPEFNATGPMERFYENQYAVLRGPDGSNQSSLGRITYVPGSEDEILVRPLERKNRDDVWGVRARNKEQAFALDALLDDEVKLVSLIGKAGTGKTLLAIAAGLRQATDEQRYQKLIVSRPIIPMGRDVGYLPGSLEEKLNPWMRPIFDNVEYLMGITKADKRAGRGADELINLGLIEIEPLTYIRGRSLPDQYFIVDEAQNLTPHEVKTILTRVGEGTKIVLTGDPYQIDNPYVDSESNGLTYVISRFKGQSIAASVTLFKGERSDLAELAADLL